MHEICKKLKQIYIIYIGSSKRLIKYWKKQKLSHQKQTQGDFPVFFFFNERKVKITDMKGKLKNTKIICDSECPEKNDKNTINDRINKSFCNKDSLYMNIDMSHSWQNKIKKKMHLGLFLQCLITTGRKKTIRLSLDFLMQHYCFLIDFQTYIQIYYFYLQRYSQIC